ncbi:MAG: DUF1294 domain-containing protein [Bacteroidales bacterium]|nr:DUF1294 domain-containing protein [Bacteroidales bacterium]
MPIRLLLYYLLAVNALTFILYGLDKWKAHRKQWRIPEAVLLWLAAFGGSPAALVAMHLFHHKTLHKKFRYGVPAIMFAQIAVAVFFLLLRK